MPSRHCSTPIFFVHLMSTHSGVIKNSNTSGTNIVNNAEVQVDGSGLTYHFVKIVPTDTSLQNLDTYNGSVYNDMKFDVGTIVSSA
jgi:hypothetical protein